MKKIQKMYVVTVEVETMLEEIEDIIEERQEETGEVCTPEQLVNEAIGDMSLVSYKDYILTGLEKGLHSILKITDLRIKEL